MYIIPYFSLDYNGQPCKEDIQECKINIFYHNYTGESKNPAVPEVLRARYLSLRGIKSQKIYHLIPDFFLVICSYSCDESWRIAGEKTWHTYPVGRLVLFRPGTPLQFQQSPGYDRHGMMLQIARGEILGMDHFFAPDEDFIEFTDSNDRFSSLIRSIAMLPGDCYFEAQSLLFQFIAELHRYCQMQKRRKNEFADNVDHFLFAHLNRTFTRKELADELNISVSLLSHRYHAERGKPVIRRHLEMRLEQARTLLQNGNTLIQIAEMLAFCSPFHLSREFKKFFGVSPSDYLKTLNN